MSCSCEGFVLEQNNGDYLVKGTILTKTNNAKLMYWASNPATRGLSFSGSGIPYASAEMAFENTPNRGIVNIINGYFEFKIHFPNAFYTNLGSNYVQPTVYVRIIEDSGDNKVHSIPLGDGIPYRMLTYPRPYWEDRAKFFDGRDLLPMRTQEQRLRDSSYPSNRPFKMPDNFWGLSVPQ
jgi:hypothetical protein